MTSARRIGWLEVDLGLLFDETLVRRRLTVGGAVSRFPSSDIDLALVVEDRPSGRRRGRRAAGSRPATCSSRSISSTSTGAPGIDEGSRSLAYRLRFCSPDHTLTDEEVGELRAACIGAVEQEFGAILR